MGGDLWEDWGDGPPKFEVGRTAYVSIPPIFGEVVLLDACERTNWVKKGVTKEVFVIKKEPYMYIWDFRHNKDIIKKGKSREHTADE